MRGRVLGGRVSVGGKTARGDEQHRLNVLPHELKRDCKNLFTSGTSPRDAVGRIFK